MTKTTDKTCTIVQAATEPYRRGWGRKLRKTPNFQLGLAIRLSTSKPKAKSGVKYLKVGLSPILPENWGVQNTDFAREARVSVPNKENRQLRKVLLDDSARTTRGIQ
jgi:hypothetical protein